MTVYDIMYLFLEGNDQLVTLFDCDLGDNVYTGTLEDMPFDLQEREVGSIDNIGGIYGDKLVLNI